MEKFKDLYTACLSSGGYKYIDRYYEINSSTSKPKIINMQLRYWIEALEKYYHLDPADYNEKTIEEGVLIINLLANSLAILGGMNDKTENAERHYLLDFFSGCSWDLKTEKPGLYESLEELNRDYTKVSKHLVRSRQELLKDISFDKIKKYFEAARGIWIWVLEKENVKEGIGELFYDPSYLLR
ncbi:MAG: hypothetical protein K8S27_05285 [Candidatus Omnitrophica bacterium]|nr:hypothetical protein [Candidatus Omnitrophota bacterium]